MHLGAGPTGDQAAARHVAVVVVHGENAIHRPRRLVFANLEGAVEGEGGAGETASASALNWRPWSPRGGVGELSGHRRTDRRLKRGRRHDDIAEHGAVVTGFGAALAGFRLCRRRRIRSLLAGRPL